MRRQRLRSTRHSKRRRHRRRRDDVYRRTRRGRRLYSTTTTTSTAADSAGGGGGGGVDLGDVCGRRPLRVLTDRVVNRADEITTSLLRAVLSHRHRHRQCTVR